MYNYIPSSNSALIGCDHNCFDLSSTCPLQFVTVRNFFFSKLQVIVTFAEEKVMSNDFEFIIFFFCSELAVTTNARQLSRTSMVE